MPDSINVLDAGWQMPINPATGLPYPDGNIAFFAAGTTTPLTVYSDSNLTTTLGTSVACNAAGYPVSSGDAKTLIYTGTAAYKIRITSVIGGGTVAEYDNVRGALDTASFLTSAAVANRTIVPVSADRDVTIADKGKLLNVNCTSGVIAITFAAASVLTSGFWVGIRHDGTANQVKITSNGTDTFGLPGVNVTGFALTGRGHTVYIACDGAGFKIESECPALIGNTTGIVLIADRLSTPPTTPVPGARYLVTASPTGAWSTFAEHDIAEATGFGTWFRYTPAADCGWTAYVQDEDTLYTFAGSAWRGTAGMIAGLTDNTNADLAASQIAIRNSSTGVVERATLSSIVAIEHIQTQTASASAQLDFAIPAGYSAVQFRLAGIIPATDNVDLIMRFSTDNAVSYYSGASDYGYGLMLAGNPSTAELASNATSSIKIGDAIESLSGRVEVHAPSNSAARKFAEVATQIFSSNAGEMVNLVGGGGLRAASTALTHVRFLCSSGNIASGTITMYGIR